ncbi:MAG: CBS domain-containing protein [Actinobacteria bacterium]|nr:CBS domain-containing protein [Actinomycetota bacterium]
MSQVADILRHKGTAVHAIEPSASVHDAVVRMVEENVGALGVLEGDRVAGILTQRDYLRQVAASERAARTLEVREIMSAPVVSVTSEAPIDECMTIMTEERIRHLPVIDDGALAGIVSIGDLVKAKSAEQSTQIQVLHEYITAR